MDALIIYLLKSFISLGIFYFAYLLFLQKHNHFAMNRTFLLLSVLFSIIIPEIKMNYSWSSGNPVGQVFLETITIVEEPVGRAMSSENFLWGIIQAVYFAGFAFFLSRFFWRIGQLGFLVIKNSITYHDGVKVVFTDRDIAPFSFFNLIFIATNDKDTEHINEVIQHEKAHISQYHSFDILLIECVSIFQWFNPFVWMYKKSIQHIHEYQADQQVLRNGSDRFHYQQILFAQTTGIPYNSIVNSFNQSLLKKRLIMMKKEKSTKWASLRMLITIPVVAILLMAFTNNTKGTSFTIINEINPEIVQDTIKKASESEPYTVVEEMPVFLNGGDEGLKKFIASNVKYPENSRKEGIQGKVYVQFVVDEKGKVVSVKEAKTKAIKPNKDNKMVTCAAPELTEEALRVVSSLTDFTPGKQKGKAVKVAYTVPINFMLDSDKKKETK
ncbi:MAG: M56 family metallopeptidase [Bacteroidales bacterium]|nr:M56 family metallopeptidase [Bacteroidales bacterium]MCF8456481.1 M56 family metallopeptidase [Bacteroidales bacterium]